MNKDDDFKQLVEDKIQRQRLLKRLTKMLILLALLFFIGALLYAWFVTRQITNTQYQEQEETSTSDDTGLIDSDQDGLFDWQEDLYGTSNKLRDSDGDGVSDGDEVAIGHDPNYYGEGIQEDVVKPQAVLYEADPQIVFFQNQEESLASGLTLSGSTSQINKDRIRESLNLVAVAVQDSYMNRQEQEAIQLLLSKSGTYNKNSIETLIQKYERAADQLSAIQNPEIQVEINRLASNYDDVARTLREVVRNEDASEEVYFLVVEKHGQAIVELQKTLVAYNTLVQALDISFKTSDAGSFFLFSASQ